MVVKGKQCFVRKGGQNTAVLQLSAAGSDKISKVINKGYLPSEAVIRWICEWMSREEKQNDFPEETPVILADVIFWRNS